MSNPLKRRMTRVALLVAAAAPVLGIGATAANAAALPQATDLGGVSSMDAASALGGNVDNATHQAIGVAGRTGDSAQKTLIPAAQESAASAGRTLTPAAEKTVGEAAGQVGQAAGRTAQSSGGHGVAGSLPLSGVSSPQLPTQDLHAGPNLPVSGLPAL